MPDCTDVRYPGLVTPDSLEAYIDRWIDTEYHHLSPTTACCIGVVMLRHVQELGGESATPLPVIYKQESYSIGASNIPLLGQAEFFRRPICVQAQSVGSPRLDHALRCS